MLFANIMTFIVVVLQIFFYSSGIFKNAGVAEDQIPYAVIGTNAVNVFMTVVSVSDNLVFTLYRYLYNTTTDAGSHV